jgi:hypothetical protein
MARHERDREDLMAEATALVERVELRIPNEPEAIVLGVRANGCLSVYVGADPALHFNTQGELRRGFVDGKLLTAEQGRLVFLTRRRAEGEVQLVRQALDAHETLLLLADFEKRLRHLGDALQTGNYVVTRQVPADVPFEAETWRQRLPQELRVAQQPHAR